MFKKGKPQPSDDIKVIICIDMDAYYAQAEARRLKLDNSLPLAVKQWTVLIAVNYAARARGVIKNFTLAKDAKNICPEIILPHVDTIHIGENGEMIESTLEDKFKEHDRLNEKVSLRWYRSESYRILDVLKTHVDFIERASIDEMFFDVSDRVLDLMNKGEYDRRWCGKILGSDSEYETGYIPTDAQEIALMIGI
jgi:DNA polymerase eta